MDRQEFKAVALSHLDSVHRVAMQLDHRPGTVEDLVEATYQRTLKGEGDIGGRGNDVRLRLLRALHDQASERLGNAMGEAPATCGSHEQAGEETHRAQDSQEAERRATDWERADDRLESAIECLPPRCRMVLALWGTEDLTDSELAFVLDCPLAVACEWVSQAREQLAGQLVGPTPSPGHTMGGLRNVG